MAVRASKLLGVVWLGALGCGAGASEVVPEDAHAGGELSVADAVASGFVRTELATSRALPSRVDAPGRVVVRAEDDAHLSVPGSGRVREILVREGARVSVGAPLLVLDSSEAARVRGELASLQARARAASAEVDRQERLAASGVGLAVELLRAEADLRQVEAELEAARGAAALFGPGPGGTVTLRAPHDGVVVEVRARPGLAATPDGGALVSVARTDALQVRLEVYHDELRRVAVGQTVEVMATEGAQGVRGRVVEVADAADPVTRRGPVLVELDGLPEGWVAGRLVRGRVDAAPVSPLAVPVAAVVVRPDRRRVVYVEDAGALVQREVEVGRVVDGLVPVTAGLSGEEHIVVEGALLVDAMADRLL